MKKKLLYPTKKTLNLMVIERPVTQLWHMVPFIAAAAVAIALFCKFGVIDRLMAADRAESAAAGAEAQLKAVTEQLTDYDKVQLEYSRYFSEALLSDPELRPLDCMEALELIEKNIMSRSFVSSITYSANTATIQLTGITLEQASSLIAKLERLDTVAAVNLYTANTGSTEISEYGATMLLTITLQEAQKP